jgi:hypothetical protein
MIKLLHISQRDRLVVALILFIGLCYVVYNTFIVYFGDDVGYGPVAAKRIGGLLRSYYYCMRRFCLTIFPDGCCRWLMLP